MRDPELNAPLFLNVKAVQAILFDIDGTLAETDDFYIHLLAEKIGRVLFFIPIDKLMGVTRVLVMGVQTLSDAVYWLLDKIHLDFLYHKLHNRIATARDKYRYQLIQGVLPALTALNQQYKLGILTAGGEHSTRLFLRDFDLETIFQTVVSANSCIRTKPSPEPLLWAAQQLNIPPENCLRIGDTIFD